MFLGTTQKDQLIAELKINLQPKMAKELKEKGSDASFLSWTDDSNQQICIQIDEDVYIYSEHDKFFYEWETDMERDVGEYRTDTINLKQLSEEEIEDGISGFYTSLKKLKEECGDNWKQIAAECIFENN